MHEAQIAKQRAAVSSYVAWATDGEGLSPAELEAVARELDELAPK